MEGFGVLRAAQLAGVPAIEVRAISNEIEEVDRGSRLQLTTTTGMLAKAETDVMRDQARQAIAEIKSLAEESAQIHGRR